MVHTTTACASAHSTDHPRSTHSPAVLLLLLLPSEPPFAAAQHSPARTQQEWQTVVGWVMSLAASILSRGVDQSTNMRLHHSATEKQLMLHPLHPHTTERDIHLATQPPCISPVLGAVVPCWLGQAGRVQQHHAAGPLTVWREGGAEVGAEGEDRALRGAVCTSVGDAGTEGGWNKECQSDSLLLTLREASKASAVVGCFSPG